MRWRRALLLVGVALSTAALAFAGTKPAYPEVDVPAAAATPQMRAQILRVNRWWVRTHDFVPCQGCMTKPQGSDILWTFYKGQGLYPNWVRASREVLRRKIRGDDAGLRTGASEILAAARVRTLPNGLRFRVVESAYRAPDGEAPPWRDAMSNGLVMTLVIPALSDEATQADVDAALVEAREYLNAFAVHWSAGGLVEKGAGRGRWYLEYAYGTGARSRVLNGFMQSLVSLDRFARQAEILGVHDPRWTALRDRARDYVDRGVTELVRYLPRYDLGNGTSRYSLSRPGPAPVKYHVYHLQLLARLEAMAYLSPTKRAIITRYRERWGGQPLYGTLDRDSGPEIPEG